MLRTLGQDQAALAIGRYISRAREERELAISALTCEAAHAHMALARRYEALVSSADDRDQGNAGPQECEISNYTMSTHKIFPFYSAQSVQL